MRQSVLGRTPSKVAPEDGRSPDGVLLRRTTKELTEHVGGEPTATQKALIRRAAMLTLHIARMDAVALKDGQFSEHASNQYLAWSNSLVRTLATLGIKNTPRRRPTVAEHLAARAAAKTGAPA